jgi:hypothetical protein
MRIATICTLLMCLCLAASCFAQDALPNNWVGAGVGFTSGAHPPVAGWASYAVKISDKGPLYSFSSYDITPSTTKPYTLQISTRTGFATVLRQWGPMNVIGFGDAGVATAVGATTGAFSGGGAAIWRIGKTAWTIEGCVRILKTAINGNNKVYEFGTGRTF